MGTTLAATISGTLTNDTTLTGTNTLVGTVVVTNGVVLTLEPGSRVLMSTGATLVVYGQLLANGTSNAPIYFTRQVAGQRWKQIKFVGAQDSVLRYCFVEFADSAGTHLDYYDNDCNTNTPPLTRNYHEAVVALATHLEIEGCTFRNLPDSGTLYTSFCKVCYFNPSFAFTSSKISFESGEAYMIEPAPWAISKI